jgi:hypothetical protein
LTKEKVIKMTTMLDRMDPEVAKKALEQFPDFSNTMKEILSDYKNTLDKAIDSNDESLKDCYKTYDAIITSCQKELDKEDLTFEQRKEILDQMLIVAEMKDAKDLQNKKFLAAMVVAGFAAVGSIAAALLTALGGSTDIDIDDID